MMKWALVSDLHLPYTNMRHLTTWLEYLKWWKPDVIDLCGDVDDACALSKYSEGTSAEYSNLSYSYAPLIQKLFSDLREIAPNAEIVFHGGNHDIRYDHYVDKKAPALKGLITPELLWKTETYGIEYHSYADPPVKRYGKFYAHHGNYAIKGAGNSVKKMMDEFGVSLITGHTHRQAIVSQTYELTGETRVGIELGHMTDIHSSGMSYTNLRDWQSGFGYAFIDGDNVHPFVTQFIDNTVVVDGRMFRG